MRWNYNDIEEEMEERNHQIGLSFQKARQKEQADEMIKNSGLYSIDSGDGRAQLSFFPPVEKNNKMVESNQTQNEQDDEDENGI